MEGCDGQTSLLGVNTPRLGLFTPRLGVFTPSGLVGTSRRWWSVPFFPVFVFDEEFIPDGDCAAVRNAGMGC